MLTTRGDSGTAVLSLSRVTRSFAWYATAQGARSRVATVVVRAVPPRHGKHGHRGHHRGVRHHHRG